MLERHTKGVGLVGFNNAVYNEEYDLPDLSTLDFTEIDELRAKVAEEVNRLKDDEQLLRGKLSALHSAEAAKKDKQYKDFLLSEMKNQEKKTE